MNRFVTAAVAMSLSVVVIGCSGTAPTSPSSLQGAAQSGRVLLFDEGPYTSGDLNFIITAARMHQALVQISMEAEKRASFGPLKLFAQQMVQENVERLDMLRASTRNAVPSNLTIDPAHQDVLGRVLATSGSEADRAYAQGILPALEALIALYQQEGASGSSSVLRQLANDFVDRLSNYIEDLRELNNRVR